MMVGESVHSHVGDGPSRNRRPTAVLNGPQVGRACDQPERCGVDVSDRIRSRTCSHSRSTPVTVTHRRRGSSRQGVLPDPSTGRDNTAGALAPRTCPRTGAAGSRLMKLLLVTQQQIPTREAPRAFRAFEWLFLRVGPLMALEMFQTRERTRAGLADVGPRLIRLRRRNRCCFCLRT